jgi:hypothetical protein
MGDEGFVSKAARVIAGAVLRLFDALLTLIYSLCSRVVRSLPRPPARTTAVLNMASRYYTIITI